MRLILFSALILFGVCSTNAFAQQPPAQLQTPARNEAVPVPGPAEQSKAVPETAAAEDTAATENMPEWEKSMRALIARVKTLQAAQEAAKTAGDAPPQNVSEKERAIPPPDKKNPGAPGSLFSDVFYALPPDLQQEILDETELVHSDCTKKLDYAKFHDCGCIAATFMDERLKRGPDAHQYIILNEIGNGCVDEPGVAGASYDLCINQMVYISPATRGFREAELKPFCECFARTMAARYAKSPFASYEYIGEMRGEVMMECRRSFLEQR